MLSPQPEPVRARGPADERPLPLSTAIVYGLPTLGMGYMLLTLLIYFLKFSTDVLLLAPALMVLVNKPISIPAEDKNENPS